MTTTTDGHVTVLWDTRAEVGREAELEAFRAHLSAPRMGEVVPRMLELIDGSLEDGIRLIRPFRPAQ